VALNTEELRLTTKARGARLYAHAAVDAILHEFISHEVRLSYNGIEHTLDALILAVQNGPTYGGGFKVAPQARITDGLLDVCAASGINKLQGFYYLSQMKSGKHERLKGFSQFRTTRLELEFAGELPVQCDGERIGGQRFIIEVVPAALDVLAHPTAAV
jgi:diacylglycerol kinase family enzyme